ncbi:MAG: thiamine phosphate synthase, partial [Myxococcota bacterium]
ELLASTAQRAAAANGRRVRIIVNRRIDVALALRADGVHLGFDALPVSETRRLVGPTRGIGVSTHHPDEAAIQQRAGADYAHLAPIFDPFSKDATRPVLGLGALRAACASGLPILAQGGLDPSRAAEARRAGALGVAVTGTLLHADDPAAAARDLRSALDGVDAERS